MVTSKENNAGSSCFFLPSEKAGFLLLLPGASGHCFSTKDAVRSRQDSARAPVRPDSAQQPIFYDLGQTNDDSTAARFYDFFKKFSREAENRNLAEYREDTISTKQDLIIEQIKQLTLETEGYLASGLDTTGLTNELARIEDWYQFASDGVFQNKGSIHTHRNLETSHQILRELLTRTLAREASLDN